MLWWDQAQPVLRNKPKVDDGVLPLIAGILIGGLMVAPFWCLLFTWLLGG